jgi:hypothetical protein
MLTLAIQPDLLRDPRLWVAALFLIAVVGLALASRNRPKEKSFVCAKCRQEEEHSRRTIRAWRAGKRRFFCRACHRAWLRLNQEQVVFGGGYENTGCFSLLAIIAIVCGTITYSVFKVLD